METKEKTKKWGLKIAASLLMIVVGAVSMVYLALYVMLYGRIMAAINNWGKNNSAVVWGIIRAVLFECGATPGLVVCYIGILWLLNILEEKNRLPKKSFFSN